ncbi:nitrilase-related carbon-nitrogen hydrolase [Kitasatospora aureofaciens]|uniref:nitrilase-related carbon-nitrogen hydrolase n=1 Tax=Kitasatospora aureofaciens TaxID=1894 RepID=UPI0037C98BE7
MSHRNARLTLHGGRLLVERVRSGRPAAHVSAEMGVEPGPVHHRLRHRPGQCRELAEHREGPSVERARPAAEENGLALVLPYPDRDGTGFYDSISAIAADGLLDADYRKTHLYGAAEGRTYSFGQDLPPVVSLNGVAARRTASTDHRTTAADERRPTTCGAAGWGAAVGLHGRRSGGERPMYLSGFLLSAAVTHAANGPHQPTLVAIVMTCAGCATGL